MKKFLICFILISSSVSAQEIRFGDTPSLIWDFPELEVVTHFDVSVDAGIWTNNGLGLLYRIPVLAIGQHTLGVRACNDWGCGPEANLNIEILGLLPESPLNARLSILYGTRIDTSMAIQLGDAYALWARGSKLTTIEENQLGLRAGNLTVGKVYQVMNLNYSNLLLGKPLSLTGA